MTLLGKILTVLIFVMSVTFAAFAVMVFATHHHWKLAVTNPRLTEPGHDSRFPTGLKYQLADAKLDKANLESEIQRLLEQIALERGARRVALAAAEEKARATQAELENVTAQLQKKNEQLTQLDQTYKNAMDRLKEVTDEVHKLRDDVVASQKDRDEYFKEVLALTDKLNEAQSVVDSLEERRGQLLAQVSDMKLAAKRMEWVLTKHDLLAEVEDNPPEKVDGYVLATSANDLVVISIGSDDGVRPGHELDVYRNATYLGRVVVRQTEPNRAVAEILKDYQKPNSQIQKGDRVDTRLSVG